MSTQTLNRPTVVPPRTDALLSDPPAEALRGSEELAQDLDALEQAERVERDRRREEELRRAQELALFD